MCFSRSLADVLGNERLSPSGSRVKGELVKVRSVERQHNKRLKLTARVDYGMNLSSARRSLSAIR
jgi:hypothetical protein